MKHRFLLILGCATLFLPSCTLSNNQYNEIINNYINNNEIKINKTLFIDGVNSSNEETFLINKEGIINSYSTISTKYSNVCKNEYNLYEYSKGENIVYTEGNNTYNKNFSSENIIDYIGLKNIFEESKNHNVKNQKIQGTIEAKQCLGIVRSFLLNAGEFNNNYENYLFASNIKYEIYFDFESKKITSIDLNVLDIAHFFNQNIAEATWIFSFVESNEIEQTINNHPFPNINNGSSNEQIIKEKGIDFIKDCYDEIKYVSDDLFLYTNSIISPKLNFKYESSNTNVIGNDGKYYPVNVDTEVTITVHLFYSSIEYSKLDFKFLAVPKKSGTGDLGSQTNMLYKGRKAINDVNIYFIEMHKEYGVSVYVQAGDFDMLLDAGSPEDGGYVNDFLRRHISDGRLELVVASHPHSDHMGGMNTALSTIKNITYAVDYGCIRDYSAVSTTRARFKQADKYSPVIDCVNNRNGARKVLYITNDMYVTFLNTGYYEEEDKDISSYDGHETNNTSVALMLTYKNQNFFIAGDLENEAQSSMLNRENISKLDVLTSSHHGSSNANGTPLLSKTRPNVSVISTALIERGSKTSQALDQIHPIGSALKNLIYYSNKVYCNFTTGTLQVTLNGGVDVKGLGVSKPYYLDGVAVTGEENLEFKYTKYAKRYRSKYI